jgi:hypothetical protein
MRMTWVFKVKARFCVVGTGQEQGSGYWESYAYGARSSSIIKTILAIITVLAWLDFHFDREGAYFSTKIDTDVYVDQPAASSWPSPLAAATPRPSASSRGSRIALTSVSHGAALTCAPWLDLLPTSEPILPMAPERDYSLCCTVDSDLPGVPMLPRDENCTDPADHSSHRAQLVLNVSLAGASIDAESRRQRSTAADTPAAEFFATSTAAAILLLVAAVVRFLSFGELGNDPVVIWCDNSAAVLVSKDATSIKRLAYIARRCRFLQELDARRVIKLHHVPGAANPADALTKHVSPKQTFRAYMARIYNVAASQF